MFSDNKTLMNSQNMNCLIYNQTWDKEPYGKSLKFSMSFIADRKPPIMPWQTVKIAAVAGENIYECLPKITRYSTCGNSVYIRCVLNFHKMFQFWMELVYNNGRDLTCTAVMTGSDDFEILIGNSDVLR